MNQDSTILIVDDEPAGRETLAALLGTYDLTFACDGAEALARAAAPPPDLILLDVMMPHMDGFEVRRRLRADPILADVPIVLVTALDDRDSRLAGLEAGADDFISKPFDRAELRARADDHPAQPPGAAGGTRGAPRDRRPAPDGPGRLWPGGRAGHARRVAARRWLGIQLRREPWRRASADGDRNGCLPRRPGGPDERAQARADAA